MSADVEALADPVVDALALSLWDEGLVRPEHIGQLVVAHILDALPEMLRADGDAGDALRARLGGATVTRNGAES